MEGRGRPSLEDLSTCTCVPDIVHVPLCLSVCVSLSVCLSVCPSVCPSIYLSVCLSVVQREMELSALQLWNILFPGEHFTAP